MEMEPEFAARNHRLVFEAPYAHDVGAQGVPNYDVSLDGHQFLMIPRTAAHAVDIILFQNFDEELKRLVPTN